MDTSSVTFPFLLLGVLCLGPAPSWERLQVPDSATQDPQRGPHLTGCLSREQETFNCWWTAGSFQNLTEPGALRLFYTVQTESPPPFPKPKEWHECPEYSASRPNQCHFSRNYTWIWVPYCVELRSVERNITYDWKCFTVETIVQPDAPINLNWTLLNVSRSGLHFDMMVRWEPPPSAAIDVGWISLVYQVQYRLINTSHWDMLDQESGTHQPIYGLQTDKTYEVRVRCKMRGYEFGEYSDTIIVRVAEILSKDASFPMTLVMVFGVVGMVILLMLIIFTQQQRLMVILLPPVPAPKIKGIDNELLKKGKLEDLNSILSSQHMYKPDMFHDEPWVEFIELDVDEPGDKADASDTQQLLGGGSGGGGVRRGCLGSSHALSLKDDDSGRASCYDPELPMEALLTAALLPPSSEQAKMGGEGSLGGGEDESALVASHTDSPNNTTTNTASPGGAPTAAGIAPPDHPGQPQVHPQVSSSCGPNWASMDFYAQVSDVTPAGGVVLSPGSLLSQTSMPLDKNKNSEKGDEKNEEDRKKEETPKFHLLVVNPDGGYASESVAKNTGSEPQQAMPGAYQMSPPPPLPPQLMDDELPGQPATCPASPTMPGDYQSPYLLPDANPAMPTMAPVSDYTVVQDVDAQHSLLLNASTPQSPPNSAKHLPAMPVMPMGYLSPELLGNLMP